MFNKKTLLFNVILIFVLHGSVPIMLGCFDLPASLIPPESILDFSHYSEEFERIVSSMDLLGDSTVDDWLFTSKLLSVIVLTLSLTSVVVYSAIQLKRRSEK